MMQIYAMFVKGDGFSLLFPVSAFDFQGKVKYHLNTRNV